jgi:hypothetical protein
MPIMARIPETVAPSQRITKILNFFPHRITKQPFPFASTLPNSPEMVAMWLAIAGKPSAAARPSNIVGNSSAEN